MKKLLMILFSIMIVISLTSCNGDNQAIDIIVSSYQDMSDIEIVQESALSDGEMLGDAYYVIGTKNESIEVVHHYKGEYISVNIVFGEQTSDDMIVIESLRIEYCDYEKEIFIKSHAVSDENAWVNNDIGYQRLFDQIEMLSIQELRNVLKTINLL